VLVPALVYLSRASFHVTSVTTVVTAKT